jgi:hypothetical protein
MGASNSSCKTAGHYDCKTVYQGHPISIRAQGLWSLSLWSLDIQQHKYEAMSRSSGSTTREGHGVSAGPSNATREDATPWEYLEMDDLCVWIEEQKKQGQSWRHILKSHIIRSKTLGPICTEDIADIVVIGTEGGGRIKATVTIPNSFEFGDGLACSAWAVADTKKEAIGEACKNLMMNLFLQDAENHFPISKMVLKMANWKIPIEDLVQEIARRGSSDFRALAEMDPGLTLTVSIIDPTSGRQRKHNLYQEPTNQDAREAEVCQLLTEISGRVQVPSRGWAKPHDMRQMQTKAGDTVTPWREVARLVKPGTLLKFLQDRPQLFEVAVGEGGIISTFRAKPTAAPLPSRPASE